MKVYLLLMLDVHLPHDLPFVSHFLCNIIFFTTKLLGKLPIIVSQERSACNPPIH